MPTGEIAPVAGTPFDFRRARSPCACRRRPRIRRLRCAGGFDHCWVLTRTRASPRDLYSPRERACACWCSTNLPGLQVYGAYHLKTAYPGLARHLPRAGELSRTRRTTRTFRAASCGPARRTQVVHELHLQRVSASGDRTLLALAVLLAAAIRSRLARCPEKRLLSPTFMSWWFPDKRAAPRRTRTPSG